MDIDSGREGDHKSAIAMLDEELKTVESSDSKFAIINNLSLLHYAIQDCGTAATHLETARTLFSLNTITSTNLAAIYLSQYMAGNPAPCPWIRPSAMLCFVPPRDEVTSKLQRRGPGHGQHVYLPDGYSAEQHSRHGSLQTDQKSLRNPAELINGSRDSPFFPAGKISFSVSKGLI